MGHIGGCGRIGLFAVLAPHCFDEWIRGHECSLRSCSWQCADMLSARRTPVGAQHRRRLISTNKGRTLETEKIRALGRYFKNAILRVPPHLLALNLQRFPHGACGDTSRLFGAYLKEVGIEGFSYVIGYRGNVHEHTEGSHAWLQRGNLIVDLTADQFPDAPVGFVAEENSSWHAAFRRGTPTPSKFQLEGLKNSYCLIRQAMGTTNPP